MCSLKHVEERRAPSRARRDDDGAKSAQSGGGASDDGKGKLNHCDGCSIWILPEALKATNQDQSPLAIGTSVESWRKMPTLSQRKGFSEATKPGAGDADEVGHGCIITLLLSCNRLGAHLWGNARYPFSIFICFFFLTSAHHIPTVNAESPLTLEKLYSKVVEDEILKSDGQWSNLDSTT